MKKNLTILHISHYNMNPNSGLSVAVMEQLKHQAGLAEVGLLNTNSSTNPKANAEYQIFTPEKISKDSIAQLPEPFNHPDLVVFHGVYYFEYTRLAKQCVAHRIPYIIILHGSFTREAQHQKWYKKIPANILFFNRFVDQASAIQYLIEGEKEKSVTRRKKPFIISGNGTDKINQVLKKQPHSSFNFTYIGRYDPAVKGLDVLVEGVKLKEQFCREHNIKVNLYGPDHRGGQKELEQLIQRNQLADIVKINPPVHELAKQKVLAETDVFVQVSRTEGQPTGLLEAFSLGIPAIVSPATNYADDVEEHGLGWVAKPEAQSIAKAIETSYHEAGQLEKIGKKCQIYAKKHFDWGVVAKKTIQLYGDIVNEHARDVFAKSPNVGINSLLIAVLITSGLISLVVDTKNILPIVFAIIFIGMEIINSKETIARIRSHNSKLGIPALLLLLAFAFFFILTILNVGFRQTVYERMIYFFGFILIPFLCARHDVNIRLVVRDILLISACFSPPLLFMSLGAQAPGVRMSISYYMLPTFIAMVMSFALQNQYSLSRIVAKLVIFGFVFYPYFNFLFNHASRAIFVAIILCIILCILVNKTLRQKILTLVVIGVIAIVGAISFDAIMTTISSSSDFANVQIGALSKTARLYTEGKIDDGRERMYGYAINGIIESPLTGNGIGDYAEKYETYPHNFLLQAWYEGGILFFLLMLSIFIYSIYIVVFDNSTDTNLRYLLILVFSIAIVRLLLSYEFWREPSFGLYLCFTMLAFREHIKNKKRIKRKLGS